MTIIVIKCFFSTKTYFFAIAHQKSWLIWIKNNIAIENNNHVLIGCKRANRNHWCPLGWLLLWEYSWNIIWKNLFKFLKISLYYFVKVCVKNLSKICHFKVSQIHLQVLLLLENNSYNFFYTIFYCKWHLPL